MGNVRNGEGIEGQEELGTGRNEVLKPKRCIVAALF